MSDTENWSRTWKSSTDPQKQRKYRENAPQHVKDNFISANLSHVLRDELGTRNMGIRTGDRVRVMRGDRSGAEGIVNRIDRQDQKVYIDGVEEESVDGTQRQLPLRPSNLQIQSLNLDDGERLEKFNEVEDVEEIKVSDEEVEEALEEDEEEEMMNQLQGGGESGAHEQFEEDEESQDESEDESSEEESSEDEASDEPEEDKGDSESSKDPSEVVSGTVADAKESIQEAEDIDYEAVLEAEKEGKDRKTLKEFIEGKMED
jgi:large subunit ribosomal protein L24